MEDYSLVGILVISLQDQLVNDSSADAAQASTRHLIISLLYARKSDSNNMFNV
jgi:hypothetical protein